MQKEIKRKRERKKEHLEYGGHDSRGVSSLPRVNLS
jgi:hypothetical protein